ncbi:hypothetical protein EVAR_89875_1 [Eumeta japonica]|uniref:Uncharacterized protein n=1 Tax=Eumeta variegata TaxID=151549 RepID=A0A4C1ZN23_EUMVA|nr:hypothetical protein EVAR_89875_1 [Eumeta japonica]
MRHKIKINCFHPPKPSDAHREINKAVHRNSPGKHIVLAARSLLSSRKIQFPKRGTVATINIRAARGSPSAAGRGRSARHLNFYRTKQRRRRPNSE